MNMKIAPKVMGGVKPASEAKPEEEATGAPPSPEKTITDVEGSQAEVSKALQVKVDENGDPLYVKPARGVRFRLKRKEYTLGELDSLDLVQKWAVENEVDPTFIEVLSADDTWICFDKAMKSSK